MAKMSIKDINKIFKNANSVLLPVPQQLLLLKKAWLEEQRKRAIGFIENTKISDLHIDIFVITSNINRIKNLT